MQIISILQQASVRLKKTVASLYGDTFRLIAYRKSYSQIKQTLSRKIVRTKSVMLIIVCDEMFLTITWSICQPMMHNPCERLYENIVTTHRRGGWCYWDPLNIIFIQINEILICPSVTGGHPSYFEIENHF